MAVGFGDSQVDLLGQQRTPWDSLVSPEVTDPEGV